jgi:hypothetical protein
MTDEDGSGLSREYYAILLCDFHLAYVGVFSIERERERVRKRDGDWERNREGDRYIDWERERGDRLRERERGDRLRERERERERGGFIVLFQAISNSRKRNFLSHPRIFFQAGDSDRISYTSYAFPLWCKTHFRNTRWVMSNHSWNHTSLLMRRMNVCKM